MYSRNREDNCIHIWCGSTLCVTKAAHDAVRIQKVEFSTMRYCFLGACKFFVSESCLSWRHSRPCIVPWRFSKIITSEHDFHQVGF